MEFAAYCAHALTWVSLTKFDPQRGNVGGPTDFRSNKVSRYELRLPNDGYNPLERLDELRKLRGFC